MIQTLPRNFSSSGVKMSFELGTLSELLVRVSCYSILFLLEFLSWHTECVSTCTLRNDSMHKALCLLMQAFSLCLLIVKAQKDIGSATCQILLLTNFSIPVWTREENPASRARSD